MVFYTTYDNPNHNYNLKPNSKYNLKKIHATLFEPTSNSDCEKKSHWLQSTITPENLTSLGFILWRIRKK